MSLEYFRQDDNCYIWEGAWYEAREVTIRFSSPELEVRYGDEPILKLKCCCNGFGKFQDLVSDLNKFLGSPRDVHETNEEDSRFVPFLSQRFIRHLLHDAYDILKGHQLIRLSEEKAKMYLSLAFFNLILRNENIFQDEIENFYCLMNFCRNQVIEEYDHGEPDDIKYVYLMCQYWILTFKKYGNHFSKKDPEEEMWRILDKDYETGKPDWLNLKLHCFWRESEMRSEFFSMIKEITSWFSTECYNIDAIASLLDKQRKLEPEIK